MKRELEEAQALLDAARARFETGRRIYPARGNTAFAPTGEPYVEIVSGLVVPGDSTINREIDFGVGPRNILHDTAEMAVAAWEISVAEYAAGRSGVLFWRMVPEIDCWIDALEGPTGKWKTYCRMLISNLPMLYPACRSQEELEFVYPWQAANHGVSTHHREAQAQRVEGSGSGDKAPADLPGTGMRGQADQSAGPVVSGPR